jgi:hypothetical protein
VLQWPPPPRHWRRQSRRIPGVPWALIRPRSPLRPTRSKSGLASIGKGGAARERKGEKEGKERMGKDPGPGKEPEAAAQGSEDCVFTVYTVY